MRITKRTLEEAVLAVLYAKSLEHPLWINASEVYWSLPFTEVSEREVTTMLTELVEEQRVKLYLGKYQLSKEEQIRLKEREQEAQKVRILDQGIKYDDVEKSHQEKLDTKFSVRSYHILQALAVFLLGFVLGGLCWGISSAALSLETASFPHAVSLESIQESLAQVQEIQVLQGYLLALTWVLLLVISGLLYYSQIRTERKKDKP
jgi:hypothetical protein